MTPTLAPALTDEQIDGGYTAEGIALQIDAIAALWKSEYGDPRPVFDLIAAVEARAVRRERERIAAHVASMIAGNSFSETQQSALAAVVDWIAQTMQEPDHA